MREVDDAVRQEEYATAAQMYVKPVLAVLVVVLLALGAWLWWSSSRENELERSSEELVRAMDQLAAGNRDAALVQLAPVAEDGPPGTAAAARLLRAGILLDQGEQEDAVALFEAIAVDENVPEPYRNLATIRAVSANFDAMEPQAIIDRLKPLAMPGNPWFGSAGELVAMAYLQQGKEDLAGPLLAAVAKNEEVPQSLRSRTRQLAGVLGYDAIEDVEQAVRQISGANGTVAPATGAAQ